MKTGCVFLCSLRLILLERNAVAGAELVEQHIHDEQLTNFCGDGALLVWRFIGTAQQQMVGILRTNRVGETGD